MLFPQLQYVYVVESSVAVYLLKVAKPPLALIKDRRSCGDVEVSKDFAIFFIAEDAGSASSANFNYRITVIRANAQLHGAITFQEADELLLIELAVVLQPPPFALLA